MSPSLEFLATVVACAIIVNEASAAEQFPAVLNNQKEIVIKLGEPAVGGDGSQLLNVELQIENAAPGTSVVVSNAETKEFIGVISPFGLKGRTARETFSIPLRAENMSKAIDLEFSLKLRGDADNQKITIISVDR